MEKSDHIALTLVSGGVGGAEDVSRKSSRNWKRVSEKQLQL